MSRNRIDVPKDELIKLYYGQKKSKYELARVFGCSCTTILQRMREYNLENLPRSVIQTKYFKKDFSGTETDKAYMIGFRLGDLNVYQPHKKSSIIVVRCHTTQTVQVTVMQRLFEKYGKVYVSHNKKTGSYHINCYLNMSFAFLLPKSPQAPSWIVSDHRFEAAFAAGYIDAEANIGVYDGRARLKIDSYDRGIIFWFFNWMQRNKIHCPQPIRIGKKNQVYHATKGYKYNKDLWRIRVSDVDALEVLFLHIMPHIKHEKRKHDIEKCLNNIYTRLILKTHGKTAYS